MYGPLGVGEALGCSEGLADSDDRSRSRLRHGYELQWSTATVGPPLARVYGRRIGFSKHQDLMDSWYSALRDSLRDALAEHPPRAYAAGHEHNLQVIEGGAEGYTLLSGAGSPDKLTAAKIIEGTLCKEVKPGYMRLDFLRGAERRVLLTVLVADAGDGQVRETCRMYLGKRR